MHVQDNQPEPTPRPGTESGPGDDDADLLVGIADRNVAAFDRLYRRYYRRLLRFVLRVSRRPNIADEVINDTMMVVWRTAADFAGRSRVSTWIYGIAYRRTLQAVNRVRDRAEMVNLEDADLVDPVTPEDIAGSSMESRALHKMLDRLSVSHRTVIELTYFCGYRYQEIAEVMGCPVDTVKTRMFHARAKLRAFMEDKRPDAKTGDDDG